MAAAAGPVATGRPAFHAAAGVPLTFPAAALFAAKVSRKVSTMTADPLLQVLRHKPFRPFRLYVSDGSTYVIRHADLVWVAPDYAIIGVPSASAAPAQIERHEIVDLFHVTRLEPLETAAAPGDGQTA